MLDTKGLNHDSYRVHGRCYTRIAHSHTLYWKDITFDKLVVILANVLQGRARTGPVQNIVILVTINQSQYSRETSILCLVRSRLYETKLKDYFSKVMVAYRRFGGCIIKRLNARTRRAGAQIEKERVDITRKNASCRPTNQM